MRTVSCVLLRDGSVCFVFVFWTPGRALPSRPFAMLGGWLSPVCMEESTDVPSEFDDSRLRSWACPPTAPPPLTSRVPTQEPTYTNCSRGQTLGTPAPFNAWRTPFDGNYRTQVLRSTAGPAGPWTAHNISTTNHDGSATYGINDNGAPFPPHILAQSTRVLDTRGGGGGGVPVL